MEEFVNPVHVQGSTVDGLIKVDGLIHETVKVEEVVLGLFDPIDHRILDMREMRSHASHAHLSVKIAFVLHGDGTGTFLSLTLAFSSSLAKFLKLLLAVFNGGDQFAMLIPEIGGRLEEVEAVSCFLGGSTESCLLLDHEGVELVAVDEARGAELGSGVGDGVDDRGRQSFVVAVDEQDLNEFGPDLEGTLLSCCNDPLTLVLEEGSVEVQELFAKWRHDQITTHGGNCWSEFVIFEAWTGLLAQEVLKECWILDNIVEWKRRSVVNKLRQCLFIVLVEDSEDWVKGESFGPDASQWKREGGSKRHFEIESRVFDVRMQYVRMMSVIGGLRILFRAKDEDRGRMGWRERLRGSWE